MACRAWEFYQKKQELRTLTARGSRDVMRAAMAPNRAKIRCDNHYRIERRQNMAWCSDISDGGEAFDIDRWWPCLFSGELRLIRPSTWHIIGTS